MTVLPRYVNNRSINRNMVRTANHGK